MIAEEADYGNGRKNNRGGDKSFFRKIGGFPGIIHKRFNNMSL